MRWSLRMSSTDFDSLRGHLLASTREAAAVLLCGVVRSDEAGRLLVRAVLPVPEGGLEYAEQASVSIKPEWLVGIIKQAAAEGLTLAIVHSHPFSNREVRFSSIDTAGQAQLIPALQRRLAGAPLCELVFGQESIDGLVWAPGMSTPTALTEVTVLGADIEAHPTTRTPQDATDGGGDDAYARQVLIWGTVGQVRLRKLTVGVVGAGGTGSWVNAQLIHLGVGHLVPVDADVVEESNLARIAGARPDDVQTATPKVAVVERYAREHNPAVRVSPIAAAVEAPEAADALKMCDIILGCTDTVESRETMNQLALRYLIPLLDTGVEIELGGQGLRTYAARSTPVRPGGPCLRCAGFVTDAALAVEEAARRPGYIPEVPAPSVVPLNALAASMVCLDLLRVVHGLLGGVPVGTFTAYSGRSGELRRCSMDAPRCTACGELYARGDGDSHRS